MDTDSSREDTMSSSERPVRPRDAATLVIYRRGPDSPEVLMGRRSDKARFKPGVYVFPGGRSEPADTRIKPSTPLDPAIAPKLAVGGSPARAQALAMTAIRETFEEAGLLVAAPGDPGPTHHPTWATVRQRGLAPALDRLTYLGRAITPSPQPIRFHARFFAVDAAHAQGDLSGDSELSDLQWVPLRDSARLDVMGVTLLMLEALEQLLADPARFRAPFLSFQHGRRTIQWT
jgi:8-oxo-dGTP pyrophosphatase MutT (NUDIX family)